MGYIQYFYDIIPPFKKQNEEMTDGGAKLDAEEDIVNS